MHLRALVCVVFITCAAIVALSLMAPADAGPRWQPAACYLPAYLQATRMADDGFAIAADEPAVVRAALAR